jgi:cell division inhibitor SepF
MASMWRRAMVYLGLQDDDELDYGGYYDGAYGDYGEPDDGAHDRREQRASGSDDSGYDAGPRDTGTVRTARETPPDYGVPEPAPPRPREREEPSVPSTPRPSVVRTIGPTTAARVHVVEPQGFNDAQEVGDRLKANQPVILNLQGLPRELQRRLIDFSSGLAYAVAGSMQRVSHEVFLLTPSNVEVSQEEKDRLQARGLFQP